MPQIEALTAMEILDSRGRPTVQATCRLDSGAVATVQIPSGASTGTAEAQELRDGDLTRYGGLGCRTAVNNVGTILHEALRGRDFADQAPLDEALIALDGTADKSRLGANALLAVSLGFARAKAYEQDLPLYQHFANTLDADGQIAALPRPTINLFSGGKHAGGQVEIQDVLVVANGAETIDQCLAWTFAVYQSAAEIILDRYGARALVADEGGLAPPFEDAETMVATAVEAIVRAGLQPGEQVSLCVDLAASHFAEHDGYRLGGELITAAELIDMIDRWVSGYPIVSVEDGLAEEAWEEWPLLRKRLSGRAATLGDDFLVTNPDRIARAIESSAADALLLKVNQVGTLSEAAQSCRLVRKAGWRLVVSARSGETEDDWLADLGTGWNSDALKVGSITRSERLAKWNRLLAIEQATELPLNSWPNS